MLDIKIERVFLEKRLDSGFVIRIHNAEEQYKDNDYE